MRPLRGVHLCVPALGSEVNNLALTSLCAPQLSLPLRMSVVMAHPSSIVGRSENPRGPVPRCIWSHDGFGAVVSE